MRKSVCGVPLCESGRVSSGVQYNSPEPREPSYIPVINPVPRDLSPCYLLNKQGRSGLTWTERQNMIGEPEDSNGNIKNGEQSLTYKDKHTIYVLGDGIKEEPDRGTGAPITSALDEVRKAKAGKKKNGTNWTGAALVGHIWRGRGIKIQRSKVHALNRVAKAKPNPEPPPSHRRTESTWARFAVKVRTENIYLDMIIFGEGLRSPSAFGFSSDDPAYENLTPDSDSISP
ncbi:MAG: hypothetical protein J3R72DRAFT_528340 [Linnemannia gamsii]|nr:MAG: hypothetical protein J3R72DRAFT_528340 [Linnemannia gamsii]